MMYLRGGAGADRVDNAAPGHDMLDGDRPYEDEKARTSFLEQIRR